MREAGGGIHTHIRILCLDHWPSQAYRRVYFSAVLQLQTEHLRHFTVTTASICTEWSRLLQFPVMMPQTGASLWTLERAALSAEGTAAAEDNGE